MISRRAWDRARLAALGALVLGGVGCIVGAALDPAAFLHAWLCTFLFWLGVPLGGVTLVLVHDLTGGNWMATARPVLNAAIATMPLATLGGIPACLGLHALYSWTHPASALGNAFYLNPGAFYLRYAIDFVLWNLLALFAVWWPRGDAAPIAPGRSWLSAIGLILLALSASFASIDWILSLEPTFWSSIFPMTIGAGWFNTGLALVLLTIALADGEGDAQGHMADVAAILLSTTIFWAYVEFVQFLIVWEENLKDEIPWYLVRIAGGWRSAMWLSVILGFFLPFFALLTAPAKHSRRTVASVCVLILLSRVADKWWLVLPEFQGSNRFWLDVGAILALGGAMLLLFMFDLRRGRVAPAPVRLAADHG